MSVKTYLPRLAFLMHVLCSYIQRYETTIKANIPPGQSGLVDAVLVACQALDAVVRNEIPSGN